MQARRLSGASASPLRNAAAASSQRSRSGPGCRGSRRSADCRAACRARPSADPPAGSRARGAGAGELAAFAASPSAAVRQRQRIVDAAPPRDPARARPRTARWRRGRVLRRAPTRPRPKRADSDYGCSASARAKCGSAAAGQAQGQGDLAEPDQRRDVVGRERDRLARSSGRALAGSPAVRCQLSAGGPATGSRAERASRAFEKAALGRVAVAGRPSASLPSSP